MARAYLRFAALGDSTTVGIGDPVRDPDGRERCRGWARLLAEGLAAHHDLSFCNLAISGSTVADVRDRQLADAVAHAPDLASLIVGVNDVMRSTWHPDRFARDLLEVADAVAATGALLVTLRFHDHGRVFGLPPAVRRPLDNRIAAVNAAYDEVVRRHGGVRVDLAEQPGVYERAAWSVDRLHPSEIGHRMLARAVAQGLREHGVAVAPPSLEPSGGIEPTWRRNAAWVLTEGAPWMGRRARDLGPWAVRAAWGRPVEEERAVASAP
ncbi:SGNH/GDSL hydrolase family protein [Nocardioides fonticola]|uniref:SGNH/GDSL hydrolase family protein n=1 Tax=Nocardioides fonticola TaxID=450363 RepID=A0ABP7XIL7_9ACTN